MSRLSIVLVAHREQGFLRACLRSVLDQAPRDGSVEVVVVDDAAADHSGEIAAEVAASDPRVRVLPEPVRLGPAQARARALQAVAGEHVWFVEPTDLLAPGALDAVRDRLAEDLDLLVVGHVVQDVYGRQRPGRAAEDGSPVALWQLVARTALLDGQEPRPAALHRAARAVAVLDEPVYVRRALPGRSEPDRRTPPTTGRARRLARTALREVRHPRRLARRLRDWPMRTWYLLQLRMPLDPTLVVYAAYWYSAYSCNPRAIYEKARELAPWLHGVWVIDPTKAHLVPEGVDHVAPGTRRYYRLMARATYLVNNVNFPNDIVKRAAQVHVQTHHGTPLKTMGMDLATSSFTERKMNFPRLMKRVSRWDYSISQNVFTSEQWERVYPSGTFRSLETGYPRNDALVNATAEDVARVRAELGLRPGQTAVLYLPTHREYHPGYVPQLDPVTLADALGADGALLVRAHYFYRDSAPATGQASSGTVLDVADHPRIEDLYLAADVLVTDYSSAMFDYAVLDRPIVIYAPDWEEYRAKRGTTFDLMAEPPGAVARTEQELTEILVSGRAWDDDSAARRQTFRERFCSLEDGMASDRVVRTLWPAPPGGHA